MAKEELKCGLTVLERLLLLGALPAEGGISTARLVRTLRERLALTPEEVKAFEFKQKDTSVSWNDEGNKGKSYEFSPFEFVLIAERLKKLDKEEKLSYQHVSLYDKFAEPKE